MPYLLRDHDPGPRKTTVIDLTTLAWLGFFTAGVFTHGTVSYWLLGLSFATAILGRYLGFPRIVFLRKSPKTERSHP